MTRRVLIANSWSSCHGGSSTSLLDIVTNLDRNAYEPIVVCPEEGPLPDRLRAADVATVIHRNTRLSKTTIIPFASDTLAFRKLIKRENIALVHSNVGGTRSSIVAAAYLARVPYVQHVRNKLSSTASRLMGFRLATRIITNSDSAAEPLRGDAKVFGKTQTLYNAVDLTLYNDDRDCRQELQLEGRPVVGFVGQLIPRKGVLTVIDAFEAIRQQVPNAALVIVGCAPPDEPAYEQECRQRVKQLSLDDDVRFVGYRRDVPALMRTFDVFLFPTRAEPFGKVVIEAMAAGCPVVASQVGGIPEIINSKEIGALIQPDIPEEAAKETLRFLTDADLAAQTGRAGATDVRQRFGVSQMVRKLESIYTEILQAS